MLYTYDPAKVVLNVAGVNLEDLADGTFVSVERTSETFVKSTGSDGITTRIKQNDKSGSITFTLQQSSPSNGVLSSIMVLDESTGDGVVPVMVKDNLGYTVIVSAMAWIRKPPTVAYAKENQTREWVFDCANLDIVVGGAAGFVTVPPIPGIPL